MCELNTAARENLSSCAREDRLAENLAQQADRPRPLSAPFFPSAGGGGSFVLILVGQLVSSIVWPVPTHRQGEGKRDPVPPVLRSETGKKEKFGLFRVALLLYNTVTTIFWAEELVFEK